MNIKRIVPVFIGTVVGFGLGILFEEIQIRKKAEKYVEESLNKAIKEDLKEKNEDLSAEINKEQPKKDVENKADEISKQYQSTSDEKEVTVEVVKMSPEKEDAAENAAPFRSRTISTGSFQNIRTCTEKEFINADSGSKEEIVYYTDDDCFINSDGNRVEDPGMQFGDDVVDYFGTTSDDPDLVHIYNKEEDYYYEIQRKLGRCDVK